MNERITGVLKGLGLLDPNGNLVVGRGNKVKAPAGRVTDTVLVGTENEVTSEADPNAPVVISGNKTFGKGNKIIMR